VNAKQDAQARSYDPGNPSRRAMGQRRSRQRIVWVLFVLVAATTVGLALTFNSREPAAIAQQREAQAQERSKGQPAPNENRRDENVRRAQQADGASAEQGQGNVEQGHYLTTQVAMCVMCHSPRDRSGRLIEDRLFRGAPMPVRSPFPGQQWAFTAPSIAGLPGGWTEDDLVRLLTTGRRPDGTQPMPPMPPFRMNEADARAVAAFLLSLR